MFWGCGLTALAALERADLPWFVTHAPGKDAGVRHVELSARALSTRPSMPAAQSESATLMKNDNATMRWRQSWTCWWAVLGSNQ